MKGDGKMKKQYNSPILEINESVEIITTSPVNGDRYNKEVETEVDSGAFNM